MIVNGKSLLQAAPLSGMATKKIRHLGVSHGLSEAGYDIRIKQSIKFLTNGFGPYVLVTEPNGKQTITAGRFIIASAIERFQMPDHLVAVIHDKSTWARQGLSVFNTVAEPGWNGFLTLELVYHGFKDLEIHPGQGIAQVLFSTLSDAGDYGDGKYQNQEDRPVEARS